MSSENLSPERQEELRAAKSAEELEQIAKKEGCELSVDMLDGAAGGSDTNCYQCKVLANCGGYFWDPEDNGEDPFEKGCRRYEKRRPFCN